MKNKDKNFKQLPIIGGIYSHYKGGTYEVMTLSVHTETREELVIYKSIEYGSVYARPLNIWFDEVDSHIGKADRFTYRNKK